MGKAHRDNVRARKKRGEKAWKIRRERREKRRKQNLYQEELMRKKMLEYGERRMKGEDY